MEGKKTFNWKLIDIPLTRDMLVTISLMVTLKIKN